MCDVLELHFARRNRITLMNNLAISDVNTEWDYAINACIPRTILNAWHTPKSSIGEATRKWVPEKQNKKIARYPLNYFAGRWLCCLARQADQFARTKAGNLPTDVAVAVAVCAVLCFM